MSQERDPATTLAALRGRGADGFDPVRLHFLESLARRTQTQDGAVKRLLESKLSQALAAYQARFSPADMPVNGAILPPDNKTQHSALAELTDYIAQHLPNNAQAPTTAGEASVGARPELKSVRYFRETWSKLSVDKQLAHALTQGPEKAGPFNSHHLVLRSLSVMRDISPDYLTRFMSYVDALLRLELADSQMPAKTTAEGESVKKRKPSRAPSPRAGSAQKKQN